MNVPQRTPARSKPVQLHAVSSPYSTADAYKAAPEPAPAAHHSPVATAPVTTAPYPTAPVPTAPYPTAPVTTAPVTTAPLRTELRDVGGIQIRGVGEFAFGNFGSGGVGGRGPRLGRRRIDARLGRTRRQKCRPCDHEHTDDPNTGQHVPAGQYRRVVAAAGGTPQGFRYLGPVHDRPLCVGRHQLTVASRFGSFGAAGGDNLPRQVDLKSLCPGRC
jgi:hypothetical protein